MDMKFAVTLTDPKRYDYAKEKGAHLVEYKPGYFLGQGLDKKQIVEKLTPKEKHTPIILTMDQISNETFYILENLLEKNVVDYIDVGIEVSEDYRKAIIDLVHMSDKQAIISWHNGEKTPSMKELEKVYDKLTGAGADYCKIFTMAQSTDDAVRILDLMKGKENMVCSAMGEYGKYSRILSVVPPYNGKWSFAVLDKPSAPGQWKLEDMYKWKQYLENTLTWGKNRRYKRID